MRKWMVGLDVLTEFPVQLGATTMKPTRELMPYFSTDSGSDSSSKSEFL